MQKYKVILTDLAERDLEDIGDYIAYILLNPGASENTIRAIRKQIKNLQVFPESHEFDNNSKLASVGVRKTYYNLDNL